MGISSSKAGQNKDENSRLLAPAYDLLAVLLADPDDTEEMAMSFTVGGGKSGFGRQTFLDAMTTSGIPIVVAERLINGKMNLSSNIYYICIEHGAQNILAKVFSRCS